MDRINSSNARPDVNGAGKKGFHDNADLSGQDATYVTPEWLNVLQEELCNILEKNGHALNSQSRQQLFDILATEESISALAEAVEHRILALAAVTATKAALSQAIDLVSGNLQQHKDAKNPHPQYLLATTFGLDLPMTANATTLIDDEHNIFGWDGSGGATIFQTGTISWHNSRSGTIQFKPFRAFGQFLFNAYVTTADEYRFTFKIYDAKDDLIQTIDSAIYYSGGYNSKQEKYVFVLPQRERVEIDWYIRAGGTKKTDFKAAIYVDDRPVTFSPVGYTSVANSSNDSGTSTEIVDEGYEVYPNYTWFYYRSTSAQYIELSELSTLDSPVLNVPHFHRTNFTNLLNTELWVIVEVARQMVELPTSDYTAVDVQVLRALTDDNGDVVIDIPFAMRNVETLNNEKLVYTVGYYASEVTKNLSDASFPANYISGLRTIYVRPS